MRAVVLGRSGSVDRLALSDVPRPDQGPNEVLIRVHATSVVRGDIVLRRMPRAVIRLFGEKPRSILGQEFAGEVAAVGELVTRFKIGDRVFGSTAGLAQGSYAEYLCMPEHGLLTRIPATVGDQEAAVAPVGGMTALHFLTEAGVESGSRVLITGASGSVGGFGVQIAKEMGAHVTGVSGPSSLDRVVSMGADEVIDYSTEDFTRGDGRYDVVFDAAGKTTAKKVANAMTPNGRFVTTRTRRKENLGELLRLAEMLETGAVKPLIDRVFTLEEMREAHQYLESGRKQGNVLVQIQASPSSDPNGLRAELSPDREE